MSRANFGANLLAAFMLLIGGAAMFACIYLPPWLELRELRRIHADQQKHVEELEGRLTSLIKQIEHIKDDPAYVERLARREFGVATPGVDVIPVEIQHDSDTEKAPGSTQTLPDDYAGKLEQAAHANPLVRVFVLEATRPVVMGMAGAVILLALFLMTRPAVRNPS